MIVIKFGGTSVQDAAAIARAAAIVRARLSRRPTVVVSAMAGITDLLVSAAELAAAGQATDVMRVIRDIRARHLQAADDLLATDEPHDALRSELGAIVNELVRACDAIEALGYVPARTRDMVLSVGERLSVPLVAAALRERGIPAVACDARRCVVTDDRFGCAEPQWEATVSAVVAEVGGQLEQELVPVLGGFIAATETGITTTLGRGGSDYTAALVGAALGVEAIEIWTDVDGMLTADPRVVGDAQVVEHVHYDEAAELASFGAKVLHPRTIAPAVARGIPVSIHNSRDPERGGTRITADAPRRALTAIAGRGGIAVVRVRTPGMLNARGFLHALFGIFAEHGVVVDVVTTSEVSVSATVEAAELTAALVKALGALGEVEVVDQCALVAVVGMELAAHAPEMARAVAALRETTVHMLSVSATGTNLTAVVPASDLARVMRRLHAELFEAVAAG